jgi:2-(1,2-epoxy-1,2-dihydrophenyl)acetyl-CoA isomerase
MTQDPHRVRSEVDGDVWVVTLDRPDAGNALDPAMARALAAAFRERPAATRAVLLLGSGERFCVGGDVSTFASTGDPGAFVGQLARDWHEVVRLVTACPVPVVVGVHGAVAGAAVGLLGACDVVVCARSTKIRPAYGALGFSPDGGTSWTLTRALGAPRALELMLASALDLAARLAAGPVRAMVRTRSLVHGAAVRTLDEQLDEEARLIAESADDPEGREGVRAFTERRPPDFRGTDQQS